MIGGERDGFPAEAQKGWHSGSFQRHVAVEWDCTGGPVRGQQRALSLRARSPTAGRKGACLWACTESAL